MIQCVESLAPRMAAAEPWVLNEWMGTVETADDPAVLPFVTAYVRHPRFNITEVGPNTFAGGGGTPPVLVLLLNLASQGSSEARQLLEECSSSKHHLLESSVRGCSLCSTDQTPSGHFESFSLARSGTRLRTRLSSWETRRVFPRLSRNWIRLGIGTGVPGPSVLHAGGHPVR